MDFHSTQICFDFTNIWIHLFLITVCIVLVDVLRVVLKSAFALSLYILKSLVVGVWNMPLALSNVCLQNLQRAMDFGIHLFSLLRTRWREPVIQIRLDVAIYMAILACFCLMYMEMCYRKWLRNEFEPWHGSVVLHKSVQQVKPSQLLLTATAFKPSQLLLTATAFPHISVSSPWEDFSKLSDIFRLQLNEMRDECSYFFELEHVHSCMSTFIHKHIFQKMEKAYFDVMPKHEDNFFKWNEFIDLITSLVSQLQHQCSDHHSIQHNRQKFGHDQQEAVFACIRWNTVSIIQDLRQEYREKYQTDDSECLPPQAWQRARGSLNTVARSSASRKRGSVGIAGEPGCARPDNYTQESTLQKMWGTREYARRHDLYLPIEKPMCSDDTHIRSCGVLSDASIRVCVSNGTSSTM